MLKDIPELNVTDISIAIVKEKNKDLEDEWNVYLINLKSELIEGVLVSSSGYGLVNEEIKKTATLRHFLDKVAPKSSTKIEPIIEEVFCLTNEFWVSFYWNKNMYDKKFIFLPETIKEENFTTIPILNKKGVLIGN